MPTKASEQPKIDDLVNFFFKHILENIAVVTITPPLDICQTEPAIRFRDI